MPGGAQQDWVFGYGSLAAERDGSAVLPARLLGHRRCWGVAMDNRRDLPGYKWYRERASGARPGVFVAFLDVCAADDGDAVNGICRPVGAVELSALDERERNYDRVEVTALVPEARGRVWAYVGSAAGRARLAEGLRSDTAVVAREYLDAVEAGFARLGDGQLDAYRRSTDPLPPGCAVIPLERVDLP